MNRLIEKMVISGFVMAWRLAIWPTSTSPSFVKATTEGVSRLPSWFGMTRGLPASMTPTTEFVVPRSMPMTFAIAPPFHPAPSEFRLPGHLRRDRGEGVLQDLLGVLHEEEAQLAPELLRHVPDVSLGDAGERCIP